MNMTKRQKRFGFRELALGAGAAFGIGAVVMAFVIQASPNLATLRNSDEQSVVEKGDIPLVEGMKLHQVDTYLREDIHTGSVKTRQQTMVAFQRPGLVQSLLCDEGQRVTSGQELAVMDNRHLLAEQQSIEAKLAQAQSVLRELNKGPRAEVIQAARSMVDDLNAQLDAQEMRLNRSERLLNSNSIAQQDYERELFAKQGLAARRDASQSQLDELLAGTRIEQIDAQQSMIKSLEAEQRRIQYNLDDCIVRAPFDGIIVSRFIDSGAVVIAGAPVYELIDDKNLEIHLGVPQDLTEQLQAGNVYRVTAGDTIVEGRLRAVLPQLDAATRTYKAILDISLEPEQHSSLAAGQLATVELIEEVAEPGFWIPSLALTADHSGLWCCYTATKDSAGNTIAVKQAVEILHMRDEFVFVRGTLLDGQILIRGGVPRVVAGQQVRVKMTKPSMESSTPWSTTSLPSGAAN